MVPTTGVSSGRYDGTVHGALRLRREHAGPVRSDRPIVPDPCHLPVFGGREMEQERLMDYMGSGFRAGFRRGLRVAWDAMCFRPFRFEPWPAPSMPSLREHLEAYGGTRMSPADFDRCEDAWYRMLDERNRMFDRYLTGMRCARYVLLNRSEVLPSTTEQGIVRAGAGEHEAQFAMIDPVDEKPVALDVEFAAALPKRGSTC